MPMKNTSLVWSDSQVRNDPKRRALTPESVERLYSADYKPDLVRKGSARYVPWERKGVRLARGESKTLDITIGERQKQVLIEIYRSFQTEHAAEAGESRDGVAQGVPSSGQGRQTARPDP